MFLKQSSVREGGKLIILLLSLTRTMEPHRPAVPHRPTGDEIATPQLPPKPKPMPRVFLPHDEEEAQDRAPPTQLPPTPSIPSRDEYTPPLPPRLSDLPTKPQPVHSKVAGEQTSSPPDSTQYQSPPLPSQFPLSPPPCGTLPRSHRPGANAPSSQLKNHRVRYSSLPTMVSDEQYLPSAKELQQLVQTTGAAVENKRAHESAAPGKGEAFSIETLVTSYANLLPTRVKVEQGYFDFERNFGVTTGEIYNLHFIKKVKSVSVLDTLSQRHTLPLNASVEYCLLHNPDADEERARTGHTYRTVGDIMALKALPTVVRAKTAYRAGDPSSSVDELELLIVLQVTKKHKFLRNRVLSVYSVTCATKKMLSEECEGNFTTDPYGTKLFLPEILQHIENPFPVPALLFISPDVTHNIPIHLFDELLLLEGLVEIKSVIATTACALPNDPSSGTLIEFPVTLPFTVTLLDSTSASLQDRTRDIIDVFDPSSVNTCAISVDPRKGHERLGLVVEVPQYEPLFTTGDGSIIYDELTREDSEDVGHVCINEQPQPGGSLGTIPRQMGPVPGTDSERISLLELQIEVRNLWCWVVVL